MLRCLAADRAARHLVPALVVALGVEVGLRTLDLRCLARLAGVSLEFATRLSASGEPALGPSDRARLRAVRIIMRHWPWGASGPCLRQALVGGRLLRRRNPGLALGASRDTGSTVAHAWLVVDGVALDSGADRWTPLVRPGAA